MAFRLLHTADWHLGQTLHGIDRTHEHQGLIAWLLESIGREEVDAVLVAGDVFDAANPPTEAQALWYGFLVEAWRQHPHLQVVVVGGNHDSAARLQMSDPFLRALQRLHVIGGLPKTGGRPDPERMVVPLSDRSGQVAAWVAAVPFLRGADAGPPGEDTLGRGVRQAYDEVLAIARARRTPGQALVAMGHLYMVGSAVSELSERKLVVGNQGAVPHDVFPGDIAYAALGHLHLAQKVGDRETIRYAGSLLPLSLDERRYRHGVLLVDLEGEAVRSIRPFDAPRLVELPRIPEGEGSVTEAEALAAIARLPARGMAPQAQRPLLEVCVRLERPEPSLRQRVEKALEGKEARLVRLGIDQAGTSKALGDLEARPIAELSPEEVFRRKYEKDFGGAPPDELLAAFLELRDQVEQEGA